ncbi:MAG TPA: N-6 DNA methylase [Candidatus Binatia bacterium]|jgi:methylase of polypeptide subunit release factors|nr:N-6 DNA methylase [Candidatus Binatia bacterium]
MNARVGNAVVTPRARGEDGAVYLAGLALDEKRRGGRVYTPAHLVAFVLDEVGYTSREAIEGLTVLDPACGAGAFVAEAIDRLAFRFKLLGIPVGRGRSGERFLATIERNVFAVDVDPEACRLTLEAVRTAVCHVGAGDAPEAFFTRNVFCADFLLDPWEVRLPASARKGFNFVVGNPPYVSATRLTAIHKSRLASRFETARGRVDLYTVFMERAVELLRSNGRLGVVTPDKFLVSQSARALRSLMLRTTTIRTIARFRSHKLFKGAATVPCVSVWERGQVAVGPRILDCSERTVATRKIIEVTDDLVMQERLTSGPWVLRPRSVAELARRLQEGHPPLMRHVQRLSAGVATGRDGIYVLPAECEDEVERDLLHPALRGRDIQPYSIVDSRRKVLVPYDFSQSGSPRLIDLERFPGAAGYLRRHKVELESRHCVRVWKKAWYDLHDPLGEDLAKLPKIVVPDLAISNRFAIDCGRYFVLHSAYYIVPKSYDDAYFLLGVLNSRVIELLVRVHAPVAKDGFVRYRRQFVSVLPIPRATPAVAQRIAAAARNGNGPEVDHLVSAIFGLGNADKARIEAFLSSKR